MKLFIVRCPIRRQRQAFHDYFHKFYLLINRQLDYQLSNWKSNYFDVGRWVLSELYFFWRWFETHLLWVFIFQVYWLGTAERPTKESNENEWKWCKRSKIVWLSIKRNWNRLENYRFKLLTNHSNCCWIICSFYNHKWAQLNQFYNVFADRIFCIIFFSSIFFITLMQERWTREYLTNYSTCYNQSIWRPYFIA